MTNRRKPEWLKIKLPQNSLPATGNTICSSGLCPNRSECWAHGTATFMIGGDICTRSCKFCNVTTGRPQPLDAKEPENIAATVYSLRLKHAVITSVSRDDLDDLGASHWVRVIEAVKAKNPDTTMEVLIPDFQGRKDFVHRILEAHPDVVSHNLETVRRLSPSVRSRATYDISLEVVRQTADYGIVAKSGIMLGLGETRDEIIATMDDLLHAGCSVMTLGQYLQPSRSNIEVTEYVHPSVFAAYRQTGLEKGFTHIESGPLIRSSYHAERHVKK